MKRSQRLMTCLFTMALLVMLAPPSDTYERYRNSSGSGNCVQCHPEFKDGPGDFLHDLHVGGSDPVTGNCLLCHTTSGTDNPFTMWSAANNGNGRGCVGCHGRDYGETITANYGGFTIKGEAKSSGYGLRKHHKNSRETVCLNGHPDVNQSQIKPEYTKPIYYGRSDVKLGGKAVNPCNNEDTANDPDKEGLDNQLLFT